MSKKSRTGSENGQRMIYDIGSIELPKQKAKISAKMFQFNKMKKKGRRK